MADQNWHPERDWHPEKHRGTFDTGLVYWRLRWRDTEVTTRAVAACPSHAKAIEEACRRARVLDRKFYSLSFRQVIRRLPSPQYPWQHYWYVFTYEKGKIADG